LAPSQPSEPGSALGDAHLHVEGRVNIVRLLPQRSRLFRRAGIVFENRETSNGVGQIERWSVLVAAIERQGFVIARFGQLCTPRLIVDVAEMPNRVSEPERLPHLAEEGDRFFIVPSRGLGIWQTPLQLTEIPKHLGQLGSVAFLSQEIGDEEEIALGVREAILSSGLEGLLQKVVGDR
jgi:hypothetical protein